MASSNTEELSPEGALFYHALHIELFREMVRIMDDSSEDATRLKLGYSVPATALGSAAAMALFERMKDPDNPDEPRTAAWRDVLLDAGQHLNDAYNQAILTLFDPTMFSKSSSESSTKN